MPNQNKGSPHSTRVSPYSTPLKPTPTQTTTCICLSPWNTNISSSDSFPLNPTRESNPHSTPKRPTQSHRLASGIDGPSRPPELAAFGPAWLGFFSRRTKDKPILLGLQFFWTRREKSDSYCGWRKSTSHHPRQPGMMLPHGFKVLGSGVRSQCVLTHLGIPHKADIMSKACDACSSGRRLWASSRDLQMFHESCFLFEQPLAKLASQHRQQRSQSNFGTFTGPLGTMALARFGSLNSAD